MPRGRYPEQITYWAPTEGSNDYGADEFIGPTHLMGRWEDSQELFRNSSGDEQNSAAVCFLDGDVINGGYLARGSYAESDPLNVHDAVEIKQVSRIRNIRYSMQEIKAYM
jgi:hypothetical protein